MLSAVLDVGDIIKTFHPLLLFHLLKPKVLFGCHLQYCVFQKSFWQLILKRFCFNKKARCVHSAFVGRVPLTFCIIIKKTVNLFKPHPPVVKFWTLQCMPPKPVIFKARNTVGCLNYFKEVAKNSQIKINFIFKKQHACHISLVRFRRIIAEIRKLNK